MSKHSEAPWHLHGLNIRDRNGDVIAKLIHDQAGEGVGAHEILPNGNLITAAPKLLECLKHAEAQACVDAATLRFLSKVRDQEANLKYAAERERWADTFASVIAEAEKS